MKGVQEEGASTFAEDNTAAVFNCFSVIPTLEEAVVEDAASDDLLELPSEFSNSLLISL